MSYTGEQTCVYSWGDYAVAGHEAREEQPRILEIFDQARVIQVRCSSRFSLALTASGQVWRWGLDLAESKFIPQHKPFRVPNLEGVFVTKIACTTPGGDYGTSHCACISDKLDLYVWGSNRSFQLALPEEVPLKDAPFKIMDKVSDVACGDNHTIAIIEGDVFCWGDQYGQKPKAVLTGQHATNVEAGGYGFCGALTKDHTLYTWCLSHGVSEGDFLGHGARYQPGSSTPKPVQSLLHNVQYFVCGWIHAAAVTLNGDLYTWGEGDTNRLGHAPNNELSRHKNVPTLVQGMEGTNIKKLTLSRGNEGALTGSGEVFTWGGSAHGGHHLNVVPTLLPLPSLMCQDASVQDISCGKAHTVVVITMRSSLKYLCNLVIAKHINLFLPVVVDLPIELKEGLASVLNDRRKLTQEIAEKLKVDIKPIEIVPPSISLRERLHNFIFGRGNDDSGSDSDSDVDIAGSFEYEWRGDEGEPSGNGGGGGGGGGDGGGDDGSGDDGIAIG